MEAKLFIPAHAEPTENTAPLAEIIIEKVHVIAEDIRRIWAGQPAGLL